MMRKYFWIFAILFLFALHGYSQGTSKKIGTVMRNVMEYGAKGDGVTKDTAAIQRAINDGGIVYFPPGTYISGTLYLKSNGGLHLETGAVLKASPDKADYNKDDFCPQNFRAPREFVSGAHFIIALEQENITLSGFGKIDGNRQAFYGTKEEPTCDKIAFSAKFPKSQLKKGWRPAQMLYFVECRNINITDLKLYNSPYWTCFVHGCEDVQIRGLRILNDQRTHNGDGIDIDCSRRVTISDCIIDTGDDCITLRGSGHRLKKDKPCEYITVTNCILHTNCNAIRLGVGNGVIRNAVFSNIICYSSGTGIDIVSNYLNKPDTGVQIENISFSNMQINANHPFQLLSRARGATKVPAAKLIRNIRFSNIRATFDAHNQICGSGGRGIENISFDNIDLECTGSSLPHSDDITKAYGEWTKRQTRGAFYISHAKDIRFNRVRINWAGKPHWKYGIISYNAGNIEVTDCELGKPVKLNSPTGK